MSASWIPPVAHHSNDVRMRARHLFGDLRRSISRAVVDHDDLAIHSVRKRSVQNSLQQGPDELLFVIERNQDRKSRHRREK
jgi:hypothetical protein